MKRTLPIADESELAAFAIRLAAQLRVGDCIGLKGPLGAGKTTLVRHLVAALAQRPVEVSSPSFTLVQIYDDIGEVPVWHVDLYRISSEREWEELGVEDALNTVAVLIEWPERAGTRLPGDRLELTLEAATGKATARTLRITPFGAWNERLGDV